MGSGGLAEAQIVRVGGFEKERIDAGRRGRGSLLCMGGQNVRAGSSGLIAAWERVLLDRAVA